MEWKRKELRLRAQTFEVLTGGDLAADNAEGHDDSAAAEGTESNLSFIPLPEPMVRDLRVSLHVWSPEPPPPMHLSPAGAVE